LVSQSVANALLLDPDNILMRRNKLFYLRNYEKPEFFQPSLVGLWINRKCIGVFGVERKLEVFRIFRKSLNSTNVIYWNVVLLTSSTLDSSSMSKKRFIFDIFLILKTSLKSVKNNNKFLVTSRTSRWSKISSIERGHRRLFWLFKTCSTFVGW
jgi:hypothetical protein